MVETFTHTVKYGLASLLFIAPFLGHQLNSFRQKANSSASAICDVDSSEDSIIVDSKGLVIANPDVGEDSQEINSPVSKDAEKNYRFGSRLDELTFYQNQTPVEVDVLARLLVGEAMKCTPEEKVAVAWTVINRTKDGIRQNGENIVDCALARKQYSCFNRDEETYSMVCDPRRYAPQSYRECLELAEDILSGDYPDPTSGAAFYYNPDAMKIIGHKTRFIKEKIKTKSGKIKTVRKKVTEVVRKTPSWIYEHTKVGRLPTSEGQTQHVFYR